MGQAREVMDRLTESVTTTRDLKAIGECYAEDAVAQTPDEAELHGRDAIVDWWRQMLDAVPDGRFQSVHEYEVGDTAIDEGYFYGTNTGPLVTPDGVTLPATHKQVRIRGVDLCKVANGQIVDYRLYFDQMEFLGQLGLLPA